MQAVHEIMVNEAAMTIAVGPVLFDRPRLERVPELFSEAKREICGESPHAGLKETYQFYARLLGPKFNRRFQAANYWLWLGNKMQPVTADMFRMCGKNWRQYDNRLVYRAHQVLPYIKEAERDGLHHLIPAIAAFGKSPSDIRKEIGPATWRRIAHNSRTRNRKLLQTAARPQIMNMLAANFVALLDFPSGVLSAVLDPSSVDYAVAARVCERKTFMGLEAAYHMVVDAHRMIGEAFNPNWSMSRIKHEHDRAAVERIKTKYSDKSFVGAWSTVVDGYTFTLLTSPLEIGLEGASQHHCVGSYVHEAKSGKYRVYRIEGPERATLGLYVRGPNFWAVDQVYGACNQAVSEKCRDAAFKVAKAISEARSIAA